MHDLRNFLKVTRALSDPNRVKILKLLQHGPMFVSELWQALGVAQPTVSKHLKVLEDAGLIDFHKHGTWVRYHLTEGEICPCAASLLCDLKHWFENDPQVVMLYDALPTPRELELRERQV